MISKKSNGLSKSDVITTFIRLNIRFYDYKKQKEFIMLSFFMRKDIEEVKLLFVAEDEKKNDQ